MHQPVEDEIEVGEGQTSLAASLAFFLGIIGLASAAAAQAA